MEVFGIFLGTQISLFFKTYSDIPIEFHILIKF